MCAHFGEIFIYSHTVLCFRWDQVTNLHLQANGYNFPHTVSYPQAQPALHSIMIGTMMDEVSSLLIEGL